MQMVARLRGLVWKQFRCHWWGRACAFIMEGLRGFMHTRLLSGTLLSGLLLCVLRHNKVAVDEFRSGLLNRSARDNLFQLPEAEHLYLPWTMIRHQPEIDIYYRYPFEKFFPLPGVAGKVFESSAKRSANAKSSAEEKGVMYDFRRTKDLADVLLMPSPGEQFWLKIDCSDIWLNRISADLSMEVRYSQCAKSRARN